MRPCYCPRSAVVCCDAEYVCAGCGVVFGSARGSVFKEAPRQAPVAPQHLGSDPSVYSDDERRRVSYAERTMAVTDQLLAPGVIGRQAVAYVDALLRRCGSMRAYSAHYLCAACVLAAYRTCGVESIESDLCDRLGLDVRRFRYHRRLVWRTLDVRPADYALAVKQHIKRGCYRLDAGIQAEFGACGVYGPWQDRNPDSTAGPAAVAAYLLYLQDGGHIPLYKVCRAVGAHVKSAVAVMESDPGRGVML